MVPYVATDLSLRLLGPTAAPTGTDADIRLDGQVYRRLVPGYYAYLRAQMGRAQQAHAGGLLDNASYQTLADRFNALHADAVARFGEAALRTAVRAFNPRSYQAPGSNDVVDLSSPPAPRRIWDGQGAFAGYDGPLAQAAPVTRGQRLRIALGEVTVTGYHGPDADFPGGWVDVRTDAGVAGQVDLRYARGLDGRRLVPMTYTPAEQRAAASPDDPTPLADADLILPAPRPPHVYPAGDADPALRFTHPVSSAAVAQVDAIREAAMALGWTEAQLYQNRGRYTFPCGQDYGLVCHLARGARPGAVTAEAIEIVPADPGGAVLTVARRVGGQATLW